MTESLDLATIRHSVGVTHSDVSALCSHVDDLLAEVDRLRELLFKVYEAVGEDTDGFTTCPKPGSWTPDVPELALRAVIDLRSQYESDYDALDAEVERLRANQATTVPYDC